jgi:hypothetical protein
MGWLLGHLNWLALGALPWWTWIVVAVVAAIVTLLLLQPPPLGQLVAVCIVVAGTAVGFKSWGYQQGEAFVTAEWEAKAEAERKRLAAEFNRALGEEKLRSAAAEGRNAKLEKDMEDVIQASLTTATTPATSDVYLRCGVPPSIAGGLYDLGRGRANGKAKHPTRPTGLQRLLRRGGPPASSQ